MNSKILFVAIAIVAAFGLAVVVGLASVTAAPVLAQDNMTMGGNMTDANSTQTGSISGCGNECF
jgi:Flp pilus assembly protein CpaB